MGNALTAEEQSQVREYLGFRDSSQTEFSKLEGAFRLLEDSGAAQVRARLSALAKIEEALLEEIENIKVTEVEDVKLRGPTAQRTLFRMGNRYARQISTILGVRMIRAPFSTGPRFGVAGRA